MFEKMVLEIKHKLYIQIKENLKDYDRKSHSQKMNEKLDLLDNSLDSFSVRELREIKDLSEAIKIMNDYLKEKSDNTTDKNNVNVKKI